MNRLAKRLERIARDVTAADEGMEYVVEGCLCSTEEDNYENGASGRIDTEWDVDIRGRYANVEECLKAVCEDLNFDWDASGWTYFDDGEITKPFMVNAENIEANDSDIEKWKVGKKRLWICDVRVHIVKRVDKDIDESDLPSFVSK